jgi:hypothetical protein
MVWIIGEYAERIDNADELLAAFLESFPEEPAMVCVCVCVCTSLSECLAGKPCPPSLAAASSLTH